MPHANVLESFSSLMKRGYTGICRKMSPKRLLRNVDEFPVFTTSAVTTSAHRWNGLRTGWQESGSRLRIRSNGMDWILVHVLWSTISG